MKPIKVTAAALLFVFVSSAGAFSGKVVLPEKTEIKVKFDSALQINSGKLQPGLTLSIYLAEDIKVGGITIVEASAEGTAKVEEIVEASRPGKPGKITVAFSELGTKGKYRTAKDAKIKLAGSIEREGKSRKLLSILFIFGLFIKGSQGEIDTAQEYTATISETIVLESD